MSLINVGAAEPFDIWVNLEIQTKNVTQLVPKITGDFFCMFHCPPSPKRKKKGYQPQSGNPSFDIFK